MNVWLHYRHFDDKTSLIGGQLLHVMTSAIVFFNVIRLASI